MTRLEELINEVASAREKFIKTVIGLTPAKTQFKPNKDSWSIAENAEHLVWAEKIGINGMWKALDGIKSDKPIWKGEPVHRGLSIEEVVEKTWEEKEQAPEIAKPKWGGPIDFWLSALRNNQNQLVDLGKALYGFDLENIIYPHPISGPLDVFQRMEFLRFHLDRHKFQVERILERILSYQKFGMVEVFKTNVQQHERAEQIE